MNEIYSRPDNYLPRWITSELQQAALEHPVVVLTGARQVGKSTLLHQEQPFCQWRFRSLDDFDTLRQARENPEGLWADAPGIVLDEVQRAPDLLLAVKSAVDRQPGKTRFILSGSANLLLMKQVSESLAGRAVYLVLDPMTLGELHQEPAPELLARALGGDWPAEGRLEFAPPDPVPLMFRGLMPPLLRLESPGAWVRWWEGYVGTYLERDLRQISQIDALLDLRRTMELVALRSGQLLNQSELARDARLSQSTVHRYLNILEATHLFERLPTWASSHTTRLMKSPKAFWNDTGLAVFLCGYYSVEDLRRARELGSIFETWIYHHLRVLVQKLTPAARLYFWRTQRGDEVDFVVEHGRRVLAIEVKLDPQPGYQQTEGLRRFLAEHPHAVGGLLLHGGTEIRRIDAKIVALPWTLLTGGQP